MFDTLLTFLFHFPLLKAGDGVDGDGRRGCRPGQGLSAAAGGAGAAVALRAPMGGAARPSAKGGGLGRLRRQLAAAAAATAALWGVAAGRGGLHGTG